MKSKVHNIPAHPILSAWQMYYTGGWGVRERQKRTEEKKVVPICAMKAYIRGVEV
jgi:hypothetical protein